MFNKLPLILLAMSLSACSAIQYKQGLQLMNINHTNSRRDGIVEYPKRFGRNGVIRFTKPPISIGIRQKEKTNVLFIGPGVLVPLPVLPWPPGIIQAFRKNPGNKNKLELIVSLNSEERNEVLRVDPQQISIKIGTTIINPVGFTIVPRYQNSQNDKPMENMTAAPISMDNKVELVLLFDVLYSDVDDAELNMGKVFIGSEAIDVPTIYVMNKNKFKLWWAYTINT